MSIVCLALLLAVVAGGIGASVLPELRTGPTMFDEPATQSVHVRETLYERTGVDPQSNVVALVEVPAGMRAAASRKRVRDVVGLLRRDPGIGRVVTGAQPGGQALVSRDGRLTAVVAGLRTQSERAASATAARLLDATARLQGVRLGGAAVVDRDIDAAVSRDIVRAEILALPLLFLCLFFVFRGAIAAGVPILLGVLTVLGALLCLRIGASIVPLSAFALNLVTGLGLGLSIDYSLLVLTRYRDERTRHAPPAAMAITLATAGRTVVFSALTVAGALAVLIVFPQPFVYSMAIGGTCVAVLAGVLAVTVLPALLALLDPWLGRSTEQERRGARSERRWAAVGRAVTRRPAASAVCALVVLLAMVVPLRHARFTFGDDRVLPRDSQARIVTETLVARFPRGSQEPVRVLLTARRGEHLDPRALRAYAGAVAALPGVAGVDPPQPLAATAAVLTVRPVARGKDPRTLELVRRLRALPAPASAAVGGEAAALVDLHESLRDRLPLALLLVGAWLLVLVGCLTRSIALAVATLAMSALSLAASLGLLVLAFQSGWMARPLDFTAEGAIGSAEPIVLLFLVLALTSDYATFLLARIHESRGLGVREAVVTGVAKTGRVVTSAALLFAIALGAFVTSSNVYVKQLGFGATVAVLLDATLVRALLLPATIVLLGRWAWWAPRAPTRMRRPADETRIHR